MGDKIHHVMTYFDFCTVSIIGCRKKHLKSLQTVNSNFGNLSCKSLALSLGSVGKAAATTVSRLCCVTQSSDLHASHVRYTVHQLTSTALPNMRVLRTQHIICLIIAPGHAYHHGAPTESASIPRSAAVDILIFEKLKHNTKRRELETSHLIHTFQT